MIYAISDLHLSFGNNKPMDIFGVNWEDHFNKIADDWKAKVKDDDLVLLCGDFSWATYLEDTKEDFEYLTSLPGKKLMLKGNHDYWWTTVTKMKKYLEDNNYTNIDFIFNNSIEYGAYSICGTRGWGKTEGEEYDDKKIFEREYMRLENSLKQATKENIIVMLHYPPNEKMIEIMKQYNVKHCIYGHLHGTYDTKIEGNIDGIEYILTSCDYLNFKLKEIAK